MNDYFEDINKLSSSLNLDQELFYVNSNNTWREIQLPYFITKWDNLFTNNPKNKDFKELSNEEKQSVISILISEITPIEIEKDRYEEKWEISLGINPFGKDINDCTPGERKRIIVILRSEFGIIREKNYKEGVNNK